MSVIRNTGELLSFEKFMSIPNSLYKTVGINPSKWRQNKTEATSYWMSFIYTIGVTNVNLIIVAELVYLFKTFGQFSSFLEATALAPCLGFGFMSDFKVAAILNNRSFIVNIQEQLNTIFPTSKRDQDRSSVVLYKRRMSLAMITFTVVYMTLIWLFNLAAIGQSAVESVFLHQDFIKRLPYFTWYPFDMSSNIVYFCTYLHQIYAGYVAVTITISADLLMCCIITQLAMHFDVITKDILEYNPQGSAADCKFLIAVVRRHQVLLKICEDLNSIFSSSILFNFLASSLIICLVGFQATVGASALDMFKYLLFLFASLMQILLICTFGNILIDSSVNISKGAYEHNWIVADNKYKKLLHVLIMRSQKESCLKVLTFDSVSLRSFNKVCSMSYQFYALLRTVYSK